MRWLLAFLMITPATAAPVCTPQVPGTVACFPRAVNLQPTDLLSGMQGVGPNTTNQTVGIQIQQIPAGMGGVTCSGTPSSSFASVNGIVTHC